MRHPLDDAVHQQFAYPTQRAILSREIAGKAAAPTPSP
jgi:hypothetical protein